MNKSIFGLGCALVIALTGCGSSVNSSTQTVTMNAIGGSGQMGTAVLVDNGNGTTSVTVSTTGGTDSGAQPAHIHIGVCGANGMIHKGLTNLTNGASVSMVNVDLASLTGNKFYINIHKSSDLSVIQACGQIQ